MASSHSEGEDEALLLSLLEEDFDDDDGDMGCNEDAAKQADDEESLEQLERQLEELKKKLLAKKSKGSKDNGNITSNAQRQTHKTLSDEEGETTSNRPGPKRKLNRTHENRGGVNENTVKSNYTLRDNALEGPFALVGRHSGNSSETRQSKRPKTNANIQPFTTTSSNEVFDLENLETYSNLRLKSRQVSQRQLASRMDTRIFHSISVLQTQTPPTLLKMHDDSASEENWVTIGLISERTMPKESSNGSKYIMFKITDLRGHYLNMFLFGEAFDKFWTEQVGTVIGVLNPKVLQPTQTNSTIALSVTNPQSLMVIGQSLDFGFCKGTRKDGQKCSKVINTREGSYCEYHIVQHYQARKEKRQEVLAATSAVYIGDPRKATTASTTALVSSFKLRAHKDPKLSAQTYALADGEHITVSTSDSNDKGKRTKIGKTLTSKGSEENERWKQMLKKEANQGARYFRGKNGVPEIEGSVSKKDLFSAEALNKMGFDPRATGNTLAIGNSAIRSELARKPTSPRKLLEKVVVEKAQFRKGTGVSAKSVNEVVLAFSDSEDDEN